MPESILGKRELCISDGSSIYIFFPDKTFRLEPIGMSGRTIKGTWTNDSHRIHIVGQWSWINGLSPNDDFREMEKIALVDLVFGGGKHGGLIAGVVL